MSKVFEAPTGEVVIKLTGEETQAIATVLGGIVDRSPGEPMFELYRRLLDSGVDHGPFGLTVETNVDYDPTDEDDFEHYVVLDVR